MLGSSVVSGDPKVSKSSSTKKRSDIIFKTGFESRTWLRKWENTERHADNMRLVNSKRSEHLDKDFKGKSLEITIKKGQHYGVECRIPMKKLLRKEPEQLYVRFYTYYAKDFGDRPGSIGYRGKSPGFDGTYGRAGWGGKPNADGTKGWSLRGSSHGKANGVTYGYYAYEVQKNDYKYGITKNYNTVIPYGKWVCVEQYMKLNTPGKKDGIARAWVDGKLVFEKKDYHWRNTDELKIESYWLNYYRGGEEPAQHDHHVYIDNLVIATDARIGTELLPNER
eukprot:Seg21789.1 transcript_id=Seg21789.1/GoldUCD/mRNA.D3Y31 product="hypothetical protein" protein_id=Seg21789.1/GoldUCD/D3Y31